MAARALVGALVMIGCSHPRPKVAPIVLGPQRELLVPVVINGEPMTLQLDTGASTTTLTPRAKQRLGLNGGAPANGQGAGGALEHVELVLLYTTEVCDHLVRYLPAAIVDVDNADGVLGMDVLGSYITEIDLAQHQLRLHKPWDTAWRTPDLEPVHYERLGGGQMRIEVVVEGRPVTAIVDLGANTSFANRRAAPDREEAGSLMTATVGADGHPATFATIHDVSVGVGDQTVVAAALLVGDLPIFGRFGVADRPAMILGADALATRRLVIDPREHQLYVSRAKN
jgi:predicted aspartyl protease